MLHVQIVILFYYQVMCINLSNNSCKFCSLGDVKSVKCPDRPSYLTFLVWSSATHPGESSCAALGGFNAEVESPLEEPLPKKLKNNLGNLEW